MCADSGYRVRVAYGDFFSVEEGDAPARVEEYSLKGAIEAAEEFLSDTVEAAAAGNLPEANAPSEMEIVAPDGRVLSLELAKTLVLCPNVSEQF